MSGGKTMSETVMKKLPIKIRQEILDGRQVAIIYELSLRLIMIYLFQISYLTSTPKQKLYDKTLFFRNFL